MKCLRALARWFGLRRSRPVTADSFVPDRNEIDSGPNWSKITAADFEANRLKIKTADSFATTRRETPADVSGPSRPKNPAGVLAQLGPKPDPRADLNAGIQAFNACSRARRIGGPRNA